MSWISFVDYVLMVELRHEDSISRNYDLDNLNGSKGGILLDRAYKRMGFDQANTHRPLILPHVSQLLTNMGYNRPADSYLHALCIQWYNWDRIRAGELRQFPLRSLDHNSLI